MTRQHNQSPSGAASDYKRESGRKSCHIGAARILHTVSPLTVGFSIQSFIKHQNILELIDPAVFSQFLLHSHRNGPYKT